MKRWTVALLLVCAGLAICAVGSQAGEASRRNPNRQRVQYPPRYTRASMSQWYVYKNRQGQVKVRQTYPGYAEHFPPPAYLYYGYPHSGDFTGLGIDGTP
jgi:hypothetical protein